MHVRADWIMGYRFSWASPLQALCVQFNPGAEPGNRGNPFVGIGDSPIGGRRLDGRNTAQTGIDLETGYLSVGQVAPGADLGERLP